MSDWISCDNHLPGTLQEVWFYVPDEPQVYPGWYEYDHWSDTGMFHRFQLPPMAYYTKKRPNNVTHWMPLEYPAPPCGEHEPRTEKGDE